MARSSSDSGGRINISAGTKKLDVDNRISLLSYFRIADNILKQAEIFREEKNVVDLYVMLLRFSSLVSETIPCHRDYRRSLQSNKFKLKKKLLAALTELEELKPDVQAKLEELQNKQGHHSNKQSNFWQKETQTSSVEYPVFKQQNWNSCLAEKPVTREFGYQGSKTLSLAKPVEEHLRRMPEKTSAYSSNNSGNYSSRSTSSGRTTQIPIQSNRNCHCGKYAIQLTLFTPNNPGRRFIKCAGLWGVKCNLWEWIDPEMCDRAKVVILEYFDKVDTLEGEKMFMQADMDILETEVKSMQIYNSYLLSESEKMRVEMEAMRIENKKLKDALQLIELKDSTIVEQQALATRRQVIIKILLVILIPIFIRKYLF